MTRNEEIVNDKNNGMSITQLARKYKLSRNRIWQIVSRKKTIEEYKESNFVPYVFGRYYPELHSGFRTTAVNSVIRKDGWRGHKISVPEFVEILSKYEPLTVDTFLNVGAKGVIFLERIKADFAAGRFDDLRRMQ